MMITSDSNQDFLDRGNLKIIKILFTTFISFTDFCNSVSSYTLKFHTVIEIKKTAIGNIYYKEHFHLLRSMLSSSQLVEYLYIWYNILKRKFTWGFFGILTFQSFSIGTGFLGSRSIDTVGTKFLLYFVLQMNVRDQEEPKFEIQYLFGETYAIFEEKILNIFSNLF